MESINKNVHYIVQIKSGPNWGNSAQQNRLEDNLRKSVSLTEQQSKGVKAQAVLGICYGKTRTKILRGYLKVVGQNFWYFISENRHLYTEIIKPIGFRAREHNENYMSNKAEAANRLTKEFLDKFCHPSGAINWNKLVESTCGNYDLDRFELSSQ